MFVTVDYQSGSVRGEKRIYGGAVYAVTKLVAEMQFALSLCHPRLHCVVLRGAMLLLMIVRERRRFIS